MPDKDGTRGLIAFGVFAAFAVGLAAFTLVTHDDVTCTKHAPQQYVRVMVDRGDGPHEELRKTNMDSATDGHCIEYVNVPNSSFWYSLTH